MDEIIKLRESFLNMQICTTIPPEQIDTIDEKLKRCGLAESGTTNGWTVDKSIEPVRCKDIPDRWHYICVC